MHSSNTRVMLAMTLLANFASAQGGDRQITVQNLCDSTIWPALFTDPAHVAPQQKTGWEAAAGSQISFTVDNNWSGRIWARTGCSFSDAGNSSLPETCQTGGCNGGFECQNPGVPPATLAEFTMNGAGMDNYDVSVVDGFNLPLNIAPSVNCPAPACDADLNPNCPAELAVKSGDTIIGCKTACAAQIGDVDANCCAGAHNLPETCPVTNIQHYSYFKDSCKTSYAYAYDESSKTALWTCDTNKKSDYTITFCPRNKQKRSHAMIHKKRFL